MKNLRPTGKQVLVLPIAPSTKAAGGIIHFAPHWQTPSGWGYIMAVGSRVKDDEIKAGRQAYFSWINGRDAMHPKGFNVKLIDYQEILLVKDVEVPQEEAA